MTSVDQMYAGLVHLRSLESYEHTVSMNSLFMPFEYTGKEERNKKMN